MSIISKLATFNKEVPFDKIDYLKAANIPPNKRIMRQDDLNYKYCMQKGIFYELDDRIHGVTGRKFQKYFTYFDDFFQNENDDSYQSSGEI